jgi:sodium-dependent dicarboxylate transporter 2/3/5
MSETYGVTIGFSQWMMLGVPIVIVSVPIAWVLLTRVLYPVGSREIAGGRELVRRQLRELGSASRAEWTVGTITTLTALAWVFRPQLAGVLPGLSDTGIAIGGALLLFLVPAYDRGRAALDWETAERLPWGVLVLFGGGISLASAIEATGLAEWIGGSLIFVGAWPLVGVILVVTTVVVYLTELTSNTATAAAFLPVVGGLAGAILVDPMLLAVPTALAASCAFMMPVATPPNAIVYGSGEIAIQQMLRAGMVLNVILIAIVTVAAVFLVPALF